MAQRRGQGEWTLVFLSGGRALAQIDLAQIDPHRLRGDIYPALLATMSERRAPWSLLLVDEDPEPDAPTLWEVPERRSRFLLAVEDWLDSAGMGTQGGLRRLHTHTLQDLRSCLARRQVTGEATVDAVAEALAAHKEEN